jgi:hypothetical protein
MDSGGAVWDARTPWQRIRRRCAIVLTLCALLPGILAACTSSSVPDTVYGGPQNHLHDELALAGAPQTVLLATHIGLYRSTNSGKTWTEVAGGARQAMDGLMLFKLAQSPVDLKRVYVLAIPRPDNPKAARAAPGIYTSANAGQTWKLAAAMTTFPTHNVFSIGVGAAGAGTVFAIIPNLQSRGVYASDDAGTTWHALPPVPTTVVSGLLGDRNHPQRVFLWSGSDGLFISDDGGMTWTPANGTHGGIFSVSRAGSTIYASGDAGLFVSQDDGTSFTLVDSADTFSLVAACAGVPAHAYALAGTTVYVTTDAGRTWRATAGMSRAPGQITADPTDPGIVYAGLSYPLGIQRTTNSGASWQQVLP